jgi:hypothetical protein
MKMRNYPPCGMELRKYWRERPGFFGAIPAKAGVRHKEHPA